MILEDVRVPAENLSARREKGFLLAMKDFDMSRPAIGAQALGIAEGAFAEMVRYAQERKTLGKALCEHQMIQQIIADSATAIEASAGSSTRRARLFDEGKRTPSSPPWRKVFPPTRR